jgi:hypothetical protein
MGNSNFFTIKLKNTYYIFISINNLECISSPFEIAGNFGLEMAFCESRFTFFFDFNGEK